MSAVLNGSTLIITLIPSNLCPPNGTKVLKGLTLNITLIPSDLSPKRDCGPEGLHSNYTQEARG